MADRLQDIDNIAINEDPIIVSKEIRARAGRLADSADPEGTISTRYDPLDMYEELSTMKYLKYLLTHGKKNPKKFKRSNYLADLDRYINILETLRDFSAERVKPEPPAKKTRARPTKTQQQGNSENQAVELRTVDEVIGQAKPHLKFFMKVDPNDPKNLKAAQALVRIVRTKLIKDVAHYHEASQYKSTFFQSVEDFDRLLHGFEEYHDELNSASAFDERLYVKVKAEEVSADLKSTQAFAQIETLLQKVWKTTNRKHLEALRSEIYEYVHSPGGTSERLETQIEEYLELPRDQKLQVSHAIYSCEQTQGLMVALAGLANKKLKAMEAA